MFMIFHDVYVESAVCCFLEAFWDLSLTLGFGSVVFVMGKCPSAAAVFEWWWVRLLRQKQLSALHLYVVGTVSETVRFYVAG